MIERMDFKGGNDAALSLFGITGDEVLTAQAFVTNQKLRKGRSFEYQGQRFELLEGIPNKDFLYVLDVTIDKPYALLRRQ
jgi:hypothetical protein